LTDPRETAKIEYKHSTQITDKLTTKIYTQKLDLDRCGYISMRHNSVRDSEAQIMREVCRDVQTEATLLLINENDYERKVNTADNARLDISAKGLWNSCENFFGHKDQTSYLTVLFYEVPSRDLPKT